MITIGVSACFFHPDPARAIYGPKTLSYLENDLAVYLARPGVMPVLIPDLPKLEKRAMVRELDGLVLQGGADLAPGSYEEAPIGDWLGDGIRDEYELDLVGNFLSENKPVLGICRGFQLLNVYFGGTLFQDIAHQRPHSIHHRDAAAYDRHHHGVRFEPGSFMEAMEAQRAGAQHGNPDEPRVNSLHHQGIKELGKGLIPQAYCREDGLVEAFVHGEAEPGMIMGVQWHPEFSHTLGSLLIDPLPIIDVFVAHARKRLG